MLHRSNYFLFFPSAIFCKKTKIQQEYVQKGNIFKAIRTRVENYQHQKMITIVNSEKDHHIYFGNDFEENDHHGKVRK